MASRERGRRRRSSPGPGGRGAIVDKGKAMGVDGPGGRARGEASALYVVGAVGVPGLLGVAVGERTTLGRQLRRVQLKLARDCRVLRTA